jgi:hypothetical protein
MTASHNHLPDISRADVDVVVVNHWTVGTPERARAAVAAIAASWEQGPWPKALVSLNCFVSTDGHSVLTYAQWISDDARLEVMKIHRPAGLPALEAAVPGIEQSDPVIYRLYRSMVPDGPRRVPGCVVVVNIEADGLERARQWVDAVLDALHGEGEPHAGLISAHFHITTDGKILNYAEWTNKDAHRDAMENGPTKGIGQTDSPEWRRVENMPTVKPIGLQRYRLHRSLTAVRKNS